MGNNDRYRGCLLAGAAGDALGYPVEFMGESSIFARYGKSGIRSYERTGGTALISDDTQMTLFTAAGLLTWDACGADRGPDGDGLSYIWNSYKDWLRTQTGPVFQEGEQRHCWLTALPELWSRRAPGNTCIGSMMGDRAGSVKAPLNDSRGCGGVMRVAPVGLYLADREDFTQDQRDLFGAETAALTHGSGLAYMPAALLTHIVSLAVRGGRNAAGADRSGWRRRDTAAVRAHARDEALCRADGAGGGSGPVRVGRPAGHPCLGRGLARGRGPGHRRFLRAALQRRP